MMNEDKCGAQPDEASKLLHAALLQMDDLVRGNGPDVKSNLQSQIRHHAEELRRLFEMFPDNETSLSEIPHNTVLYLNDYLSQNKSVTNGHLESVGSISGSLDGFKAKKQTEVDSSSLKDNVMLLHADLDSKSSLLHELEQQLQRSNDKLMKAEDRLQKEQVNKTYLEAHKLDLMSEITELRVRLQNVERERTDYRDKFEKLQRQLIDLNQNSLRKDKEMNEIKARLAKANGSFASSIVENGLAGENEVEKLKAAVEQLMAENELKERKLDELRKAVQKYQKVEEIIMQSSHSGVRTLSDVDGDNGSLSSANDAASAKPYVSNLKANGGGLRSDGSSLLTAATTAGLLSDSGESFRGGGQFATISSSPHAPRLPPPAIVHRSNSCEALRYNRVVNKASTESPPESRLKGGGGGDTTATAPFNSLPRDYRNKLNGTGGGGRKDTYDLEETSDDDAGSNKEVRKKRSGSSGGSGFKKLFARLKRSSSSEVVDRGFRRGGARATAGPRLGGWSSHVSNGSDGGGGKKHHSEDSSLPFARWDSDQVADWLHDLGLTMYVSDCRRFVRSGQQLLDASPHDIEKELRITNALHRKKLLLAIESMRLSATGAGRRLGGGGGEAEERHTNLEQQQAILNLRPEWVTRWLDDVGLPQYKDQFYEARVDGRMLNYLTVEDLLSMKIANALHHASIRRGIEVLRQNNFNLSSLKRRPQPDESSDNVGPESVVLWTNHRVMEWLRTIDLSEYAPNLRGSGVHGGLIIIEARFTVENLADLLSIPAAKSLIRRHLATHFASLIGDDAQRRKCEAETSHALQPLSLNGKVKVKKSNLFHKRTLAHFPAVDGELLCPIDDLDPIDVKKEDKKVKDAVAAYKKELTKRDHKKPKENPAKPITEYSQFSQEVRTMVGLTSTPQSSSTKA